MSSPLSAPAVTWRVLLPWLDQLAPSELLAMQRLGGPAQWWLRETPHETNVRRADMWDVFELLASFLESAPLDREPLSSLLRAMPVGKATADLEIAPHLCRALEAAGGPTLGALSRLTPRSILATPLGTPQYKRDVLAALICEGVLLGAPAPEAEERPEPAAGGVQATAPDHPEQQTEVSPPESQATGRQLSAGKDPEDAVAAWYGRLNSRQQDLIVRHLSVPGPYAPESLAARQQAIRERAEALLSELAPSLRDEAVRQPALGLAIANFTATTREPVMRVDLLEWQPWLRFRLPRWGVSVIDLLAAVLLGAPATEEWLYAGSLSHARALTREALNLDAGARLPLVRAGELLAGTGVPLRPTQAWIRSCGLDLVAGWVVRPAASPGGQTAEPVVESAVPVVEQDYLLAPPAMSEEPSQAPASSDPNAAQATAGEESGSARSVAGAAELLHALEELHSYAAKAVPGAQLVDLLDGSIALPEPLQSLAARLAAVTVTADGWVMPEEASSPELFSASLAGTGDASSADPAIGQPIELADAIADILAAAQGPLTSSEILAALPSAQDPQSVTKIRKILFNDSRMAITDRGGWTLTSTGRSASSDLADRSAAPEESGRSTGGTLRERAWRTLNEAGHPLPSPLLAERMGMDVNLRSLKVQLPSDPRFMRSDVDAWALAEWGLREYTTIKDLVEQEVDRAGGEISTAELVASLTRDFSIKESSLLQAVSSPPFTARGGVVRRISDARMEGAPPGGMRDGQEPADRPDDDGPTTDDLIDLMGL